LRSCRTGLDAMAAVLVGPILSIRS